MTTKYFNEGDSSTTAAQWLNFNTVYNEVMLLFSVESYMITLRFISLAMEFQERCIRVSKLLYAYVEYNAHVHAEVKDVLLL